jgi:2-polyprenyl-6-hydroxyphenyl methylase / 3-demethylubiquinone-9 3-methyltransferase
MSPDDLRALYNREYVDRFERIHESTTRLERILKLVELNGSEDAVDFGCGSGFLLPAVGHRVRSYVGVDFSEEFILAARRRNEKLGFKNARFECATIEQFADSHAANFDLAFALDFSEHVPDDAWTLLLGQMRGTLRPGAKLYLHTPNRAFFLERMKSHNIILRQFPEHVAVRTLRHNTNLLTKAGFEVRRTRALPHYNVLRYLHPLRRLPFVGSLFEARLFIEARA